MNVQELRWLLVAINAAPFQNTDEAIIKAKWLKDTAKRLDKADQKAKEKGE
jgi:hypothetical protein